MSDKLELNRRRVLGGLVTIGAAGAAVGAGTFALFSDEETSDGNTIQAGTLDLSLNETTSLEFSTSAAAPGDSTNTAQIEFASDGSFDGDHVEISFEAEETEATLDGSDGGDTLDGADGMSEMFEVDRLDYAGTNYLGDISDDNGNGIVDLDDLVNHGVLDDLTAPTSGSSETLEIGLTFALDDGDGGSYTGSRDHNDYQGDELTVVVNGALAQDSSQDIL